MDGPWIRVLKVPEGGCDGSSFGDGRSPLIKCDSLVDLYFRKPKEYIPKGRLAQFQEQRVKLKMAAHAGDRPNQGW